ncbi:hypothetical protein ScPMuIL_014053 [Solemya velum]
MPHDAYEAAPILEKLPLKIESIASFDDILLVGTKEGHLLQYKVKKSRGAAESKFDVSLERSNKSFSKKPITQLAAIPELYILISLSDNVVSVHDLNSFGQMSCISKTRGATLFAIDLEKPTSLSGDVQCTLRMSVAAKRKIQLFYWKNRNFLELKNDLSLYDIPRSMAWCKGSLCVGFKRDYFIIKVATGDLKELFPVGSRQLEPTVNRLGDDKLMLGRDEMSILIDGDGNPTQKYPLTWSEIPIALEYDPPYVIALLPKYIEIKTLEPRLTIQNIEFQKARLISQGSGHLYVASANHVWRMASMSISYQIRQVLQEKQFELALRLAELPSAGDEILQVESEQSVKEAIAWRKDQEAALKMDDTQKQIQVKRDEHQRLYQEELKKRLASGYRYRSKRRQKTKEVVDQHEGPALSFILKGDVDGSVEAILDVLDSYNSKKCRLNLIHYGVGNITDGDIDLAEAFQGEIFGFNVDAGPNIMKAAKTKNVEVKLHKVIYKLFDDLRESLSEKLPMSQEEEVLGQANVLQVFNITDGKKSIPVAGCRCVKGTLNRKMQFKLLRDGEEIYTGHLDSLKHHKNEVDTIKTDVECGLSLSDKRVEFQPGDTVVCFTVSEVEQDIDWEPTF